MSVFQRLHSESRSLEAACDRLLTSYSGLIANPEDDSPLELEIESNLNRRAEALRDLYNAAYEPGGTQAMLHQAQRHAEILEDHKQTSKRVKSSISQERSRRTLLSNVRQDIQSHRSGLSSRSGTATPAEQDADAERYFGGEATRIDESHSIADTLLARAYETRAELVRQQQTLKDIQRRMWRVASRVPGVNSVISKINTRQKRNSLVLVGIIVFCVLFVFFVR